MTPSTRRRSELSRPRVAHRPRGYLSPPAERLAGSRDSWCGDPCCARGRGSMMEQEAWIRAALGEADRALDHDDVPIGCVVVSADGEELARAHNSREHDNDPTAHAELIASARRRREARHLASGRRDRLRHARAVRDVRRRDGSCSRCSPRLRSAPIRRPVRQGRSTTSCKTSASITGSTSCPVCSPTSAARSSPPFSGARGIPAGRYNPRSERCESGRIGRSRKALDSGRGLVGSNPTLSAMYRTVAP